MGEGARSGAQGLGFDLIGLVSCDVKTFTDAGVDRIAGLISADWVCSNQNTRLMDSVQFQSSAAVDR